MDEGRWTNFLVARGDLLDAAEAILNAAASEQRALKADEQLVFDECASQVRSINARLAEFKRQRPR
jgi:hypothetical protein